MIQQQQLVMNDTAAHGGDSERLAVGLNLSPANHPFLLSSGFSA